jgi:hypothetical protein
MKKEEKWTPHIITGTAFVVFIVLGLACATTSSVMKSDGFSYQVSTKNDTECSIVDYDGKERDLVIPASLGGKRVVEIKKNAFKEKGLTSVTIPDSVTTIGDEAFIGNQLTSIIIPNSVVYLSGFNKNQLTSVTIPAGVTSIGDYAFAGNQLTDVVIPDSVTSIGINAFAINKLDSVTISNRVTSIKNNVFNQNQLTSITIPNSVTSIGTGAFANNQLTAITIPNSVTSIGADAFANNQLISITIPGNVTTTSSSLSTLTPYYYANNKLPGTYSRNENAWVFNGSELTKTPAVIRLGGSSGIRLSLQDINGNRSVDKYSAASGEYWLPEGTYTIRVRYTKTTRTLVSVGDIFNPNDDRYMETTQEGTAEFEGPFRAGTTYRVSASEDNYGRIEIRLN